jgi:ketosteroid isomerase-like protein
MSQENVEALRRTLDAFNRGDRTVWLALRDQDCEMVPIGDWPDARVIRGREAVWDFYRDIGQTLSFESVRVEFVDAGPDRVLGHQRHEAHGRSSGADVQVDYWFVTTFHNGKIVRDEWFTDRAEALEAAGGSE